MTLLIGTSKGTLDKHVVKKTKLIMLYKSLFIIHATVKALLISYNVVQKQSNSVTKLGVAHAQQAFRNILGFKF